MLGHAAVSYPVQVQTDEEEEDGCRGGDLNLLKQPLPPNPAIGGRVVVQVSAFKNLPQLMKDTDRRHLRFPGISSLFLK